MVFFRSRLLTTALASVIACLGLACEPGAEPAAPLFTRMAPEASGVTFENRLVEQPGLNVLEYEYFYNGGGVAVGDVDGDGLPDLYFTANMAPNRLYLNRGGLRFEDITEAAGVAGGLGWTTGVTMADVNGDGRLDLYVCRSGRVGDDRRRNELFVNNGDGTFTESAAAYGLDDPSQSTHATFFDYDADGDLDLFLLNHAIERYSRFDVAYMKSQRDALAGDKLYENRGGRFVDVSEEAGIIGNPIGFGLSATAADIDGDGWTDLYVTNDYVEDDYLYRNNGDGTFTEALREHLDHTSFYSMGSDIADLSGDGLPDVVTLDMLPPDNRRQKLLKGPDNYDRYQMMIGFGYHHQYMRNMLHVNNGDGSFSEVGQLAGIANTDWSWAALAADLDLDGRQDLVVTNGYMRDYTNMDFLKYTVPEANRQARAEGGELDLYELVEEMPSSDLPNMAFRNRDGLRFEEVSEAWGLDDVALSGGAAYADLDADGDLDLVVSNINQSAFIYENHAAGRLGRHWLRLRLEGEGANPFGVGAQVTVRTPDGAVHYREQIPARGYQSSVEPVLHVGLGEAAEVDVAVRWPDGRSQTLPAVAADQTLTLRQAEASANERRMERLKPGLLEPVDDALGLRFVHAEDDFIDFKREPLLPHMHSRFGPALAVGDVDGDGRDDIYVGGARGQMGALFVQRPDGSFAQEALPVFITHAAYEDVAATFFDANGDGALDLYVGSGGAWEAADGTVYQDRLYVNDGRGGLVYIAGALPSMPTSTGAVAAHDYDGDGDLDLFVGGRILPGRYPYAPRSYVLRNDGTGFTDATMDVAPALAEAGLVAAAAWHDLTGDGAAELVIAGEWMPVRVFAVTHDPVFEEITADLGLEATGGWWNALAVTDADGDGRADLLAGNRGWNAQAQASPDEPAAVTAADFDASGTMDAILSYYIDGEEHPVPARDELLDQLPGLKKRYPTYAAYADATMDELLDEEWNAKALRLEAQTFSSTLFVQGSDGRFEAQPLPMQAQVAPINAFALLDVDRDGVDDVLLAGNNFAARAQDGRYDAGKGLLLRGTPEGYEPVGPRASGFRAPGQVSRMAVVRVPGGEAVVVANNDATLTVFHLRASDRIAVAE